MGLKQFIVFGFILLIAMGIGIYTFSGEMYALPLAGITIKLPMAVWMIIPALILYVLTIIHMMYYGTVSYTRMRRIKKDSERFLENAKFALLGKIVGTEYKSDLFKLPGAVLPLLNIDPKRYADHRVYDDGIQDILSVKRKVSEGEVVDLSQFSLRDDNALVLKNAENRLSNDPTYATTILRKCDDKTLCQKALLSLSSYASMDEIKRYDVEPTREFFDALVERINAKENTIEMSDDQLIAYIQKLDFNEKDFIDLAKKLKGKMNPDRLMMLFEKLAHEFPHEAGEGYLYVLFELQMMDNAREFLESSSEDEYAKFKYMLFLRDHGKNFDTELFI